jgi:hypothetical protein
LSSLMTPKGPGRLTLPTKPLDTILAALKFK